MVDGIHMHFIGLAAGFDDRFVFRLANFDPQANAICEIYEPHIWLIRAKHTSTKSKRGIIIAQALQLMRLQSKEPPSE